MRIYKIKIDLFVSLKRSEINFTRKDGSLFCAILNYYSILYSPDSVGVFEIITNNNLLTNSKNIVSDTEKKYKDIFESTSDLLFSCSANGSILYSNNSFSGCLEYSFDNLEKRNFFELIHPNDFSNVVQQLDLCTPTHPSFNIEFTLLSNSNNYVVVNGNITVTFISNNVSTFIGFFRNVSDLKIAQESDYQVFRNRKIIK